MKWKELEEVMDIRLFGQMCSMIKSLCGETGALSKLRQAGRGALYRKTPDTEKMERDYDLHYPGEVLERYREKIGDSPQTVRALAMAMGEMKPLLKESMFVGEQYRTFIRTIKARAESDLYCMGALFLLEDVPEKKAALRKRLWDAPWKTVTELVYRMYLFGEEGWQNWKEELACALGEGRNLEVYGNQGLYSFVGDTYAEKMQECRRKKMNVLKAICRLSRVNADGANPVKKWMMEAGYTKTEICFLNMELLQRSILADRILPFSITAERMAVRVCLRFLGGEKEYHPEIYELCRNLLEWYQTYEIQLDGARGILESIKRADITVGNAKSYLTLYPYKHRESVPDSYFWIDLLDEKWDGLYRELGQQEYREKVAGTLVEKPYTQEEFIACLEHYQALTGESLFSCLWEKRGYLYQKLFFKMAEAGQADVRSLARQYIQDCNSLTPEEAGGKCSCAVKKQATENKR